MTGRGKVRVLLLFFFASVATVGGCKGSIDDARPHAPGNCDPETTALQVEVGSWLEDTCSHAGCHGPVGVRSPAIAAATLPQLVESGYFDPARPTQGMMARIAPSDPDQIMPPTRHENPPVVVAMLREWLAEGAPTNCIELPPPPPPAANSIDQASLFTCATPTGLAPEYALLSGFELIHRVGGYLEDEEVSGTPFPRTGEPFSNSTVGSTINPTMLGLHLDMLQSTRTFRTRERADNLNVTRNRGDREAITRWTGGLTEAQRTALACITDESRPAAEVLADEECRREFVGLFLERYAFHRRPNAGEVDRALAYLDEELALEADGERRNTLDRLAEASMLLFGALHRPLQGSAEGGLLASDEWGLALASALGTAGLSEIEATELVVTRPELGWVSDFRRRQAEGQLETVEQARTFIAQVLSLEAGFVGGEFAASLDTSRPDLFYDERLSGRPRRGRYWLAPRIARFFREYFEYGEVASLAKDEPAATSRYDRDWLHIVDRRNFDSAYFITQGQTAADGQPYSEPALKAQLDDFIAREVIEAERSGRDVWAALMTGRTYRLPASLRIDRGQGLFRSTESCDPVVCNRRGTCCDQGGCQLVGYDADDTPVGECLPLDSPKRWRHLLATLYDHEPIIEDTVAGDSEPTIASNPASDARWVTMPLQRRSGVLTHPTWLASHGGNDETGPSAVLRGHWIREHLFCEDVAGLELVSLEAQLAEYEEGQRARDRINATFGDLSAPANAPLVGEPLCANAACHGAMNELGLSFEIFNHAGFTRFDDHGHPPDGHATIARWPGQREPVEVENAIELTRMFADDPHVRRCFLRHVFRYFAGRYETAADACMLADMETAFAGGSIFAALEALFSHESFLIRAEARR